MPFKGKIETAEWAFMAVVFAMGVVGIALGFRDETLYKAYIREDGLIEWLTVLALLASAAVCLRRVIKLWGTRPRLFIALTLALAAIFFLGAGEEISWGQRILGIESPEFFQEHSLQNEINIHNLMVGEVRINRLIFSNLLGIVMAFYLIAWPLLYGRFEKVRAFSDALAVPVPRLYQVLAVVAFGMLTSLAPFKGSELLEFGISSIFILIVARPANPELFRGGRVS